MTQKKIELSNIYVKKTDSRLTDERTPTDNSVSTDKIQNNAITSAKIKNNTIVNENISNTANIAYSKLNGVAALDHSHSSNDISHTVSQVWGDEGINIDNVKDAIETLREIIVMKQTGNNSNNILLANGNNITPSTFASQEHIHSGWITLNNFFSYTWNQSAPSTMSFGTYKYNPDIHLAIWSGSKEQNIGSSYNNIAIQYGTLKPKLCPQQSIKCPAHSEPGYNFAISTDGIFVLKGKTTSGSTLGFTWQYVFIPQGTKEEILNFS